MSYAAPRTIAPAKSAKPATNKAATSGVIINAVTRNDTPSKVALQLAQNGKALLPIIISAKASDAIKLVAKDLAGYLSQISGATFEIKAGDGTSGIVLGSMSEFPTPALSKALEIRNGFDGREAFAIRTRDKKLMLLGATDMGVSHAAFRLLEELGCRWFFPHKAWEVVPSTPDLKFGREITDRPQMLNRTIWFEAGSGGADTEKEYQDWKRHNLVAESLHSNIGGGGMMLPKEIMDAHPEYWAARKQPDGTLKRDPNSYQLELGNPAVRKLLVKAAIDFFKQNPTADMVNMEPSDSTAHSESSESLALGTVSDAVFGMANEIAKALQKAFPGQGKIVGLLSYNSYYDPPSFKMEPNVHIQMASIGMNPKYTPEQRFKLWTQRSQNLGVYEYYSVFLWSGDQLPGSYTNDVRGTQRHIRDDLVAHNVVSMNAESTSSWGSNGRGYYVTQKLMWNPNLDLDALLADFYDKAFGPAAPAMEKYYDLLDPSTKPLMSGHVYGLAFKHIDEASRLAKDRPDVQARLDQIKMYLRFIFIQNAKGQKSELKNHLIDDDMMMENLYRTTPYALTAWNMIAQTWQGNDVYARGKAYPALKPYTHDEVEAEFQEGLKYFEPKIRNVGPKLTFSTDLVPIQWTTEQKGKATKETEDSTQSHQGSMRYAFYSIKGEPLEFTTEASDSWGYKTSYTVTDDKGTVLESGKPEPKVLLKHKIAVPGPGLYYLNYSDPGAYWTFTAKPGTIYSIVMLPEFATARGARPLGKIYLYVPKGTKKIEYFPTEAHKLFNPEGELVKRVENSGQANDYFSIEVPKGMDGKLWSMEWAERGYYHFFNTPSYFAPSPEALLVPREVAEKDGLMIRR